MKYLIIVTGPPYGTQNSNTSFLFSKSVIKLGHILYSIFFHFDGVLNANNLISPNNDEFNILQAWKDLYVNYNVKLNLCYSAAMRRGVIKNIKKKYSNISSCFKLTGLMKLGFCINKCDRVIQF
ncbi:sulfurtransferase complex subunit TusD [Buchnera aphidicola]|uniref:sulfurtransferase complex subunit TusD n=1 Tax=Buchnera aphidicola TaxID=9 RepID=UPI0031B80F67